MSTLLYPTRPISPEGGHVCPPGYVQDCLYLNWDRGDDWRLIATGADAVAERLQLHSPMHLRQCPRILCVTPSLGHCVMQFPDLRSRLPQVSTSIKALF